MPASPNPSITRPTPGRGALLFPLLLLSTLAASGNCPETGTASDRQAPRGGPRFAFALSTARGRYDCSQPGPDTANGRESLLASVLRPAAASFQIDTCLPTADCRAAILPTLTIEGPGLPPLDRHLRSGAFVRLTVESGRSPRCGQRILIETLKRWRGVESRAFDGFFLAGNNGISGIEEHAPFRLTAEPAGCILRLNTGDGTNTFAVPPGRQPRIWRSSKGRSWTAWNGSSSADGICADEVDWTFWIAGSTDFSQQGGRADR